MLTIGIELNHVVRNINRQILKNYAKEFDPSLEWEDLDDKVDIFKKYLKFESKYEKNNFIYIDYPFEIFGACPAMEKNLPRDINNWLADIENMEDEDIRIIFYSLDEVALTIQSSYFFLDECDVVITARNEFFEKEKPEGKKIVLINREFNEQHKDEADLNYNSLNEVIADNNFFKKVKE